MHDMIDSVKLDLNNLDIKSMRFKFYFIWLFI
jgi:hypothetical protein